MGAKALKLSCASLFAVVSLGLPLFVFASTIYGSDSYGSGTYGGSPPTVTTDSSSSIGQTSATLGGTITNIGTSSPSVRGFVYGADTTYGATTTDVTGAPFSAGSFSGTVSGLSCNSGYHFAAYATSTNGMGYGSDATFMTSTCSSGGGGGGGGGPPVGSLGPGPLVNLNAIPPATLATSSVATVATSTLQGASSTSPQSFAFTFSRDLQIGSQGEDVRALQQYLNTHGFPVAPSGPGASGQETNYFGPATQAALAKYQQASGIDPAVGYFGPKTRAYFAVVSLPVNQSIASSTPFVRDLELGDTGEDVRALQQYLNTHGFPVAPSGPGASGQETNYFGPATQAALAKYQQASGIDPAVGYFGPKTRAFISQ